MDYSYMLSVCSSAVMLALAFITVFVRIPHTGEWNAFRKVRLSMVAAFVLLGISGFIEVAEQKLTSAVVLVFASFQSLLFTCAAMAMTDTRVVTRRVVLPQFISITAYAAALAASSVSGVKGVETAVLWVGVGLYAAQLAIYVHSYENVYRRSCRRLELYYADDATSRLLPIKKLFYASLCVGVCALALVIVGDSCPLLLDVFVCVYTAYYVFVCISVVNYRISGGFIVKAAVKEQQKPAEENEGNLAEAVSRWIEEKKYLLTDVSAAEIASGMGTTSPALNRFLKANYGMTLRSLRIKLRIEEAARIIDEDSGDLHYSSLFEKVGFADRSNFHRSFVTVMGMTPKEYREKSAVAKSAS